MMDAQPPSWRKILIIRFSSIGDIVLTTPIIRSVKQQLPEAEVHFLLKKANAPLLAGNPHEDKVHVYQDDLNEVIKELKEENFDFVADLQRNRRSRKVVRALKCQNATFPKCNVKKLVYVRTKINFLQDVHIVDRYYKAVQPLHVTPDNGGLEYVVPKEDVFDIQDLPAGFEGGYIAVAVGAKHATKRIPVDKIVEIGNQLFKPMVLLGDKSDRSSAEKIVDRLGGKAVNFCGMYSINTTASIVEQSDCVLTADTGIMHIAAALRKPIASLWGNTVPELGMYPYVAPGAPKARVFEIPYLKCRPCSKLGFSRCPRRHFKCMNLISSYEVADWINQF